MQSTYMRYKENRNPNNSVKRKIRKGGYFYDISGKWNNRTETNCCGRYKKEIIAFANSNGGILYIGVDDSGNITGIHNPDETIQQIANMVRDSIKPDITMFLHYETLNYDGKNITAIHIQRGTERPYYLSKKGLRPERLCKAGHLLCTGNRHCDSSYDKRHRWRQFWIHTFSGTGADFLCRGFRIFSKRDCFWNHTEKNTWYPESR